MLLKHENNTDVAMEVLKRFYVKEKRLYLLRVAWWNIGICHAPWPLNIHERLELSSEAMSRWKLYEWRPPAASATSSGARSV